MIFTKLLGLLVLCQLTTSCPNQKNCASCKYFDEKSFCGKCFNSIYSRKSQYCEEAFTIPNCVEYVENQFAECLRCEYGYGLDTQKQCQKCKQENCAICNYQLDKCTSYFGGNVVNAQETEQVQVLSPCSDKNCDICDHKYGFCLKCKASFSLDSNLVCQKGLEGCQILHNNNPDQCLVCDYTHYINKEGKCLKNSDISYPFYKSFIFWLVILLVLIIFVLIQLSKIHFKSRRSSLANQNAERIFENEKQKEDNLIV